MPLTRILPADLKLSSSNNPLDDVGEKTGYHLALGADAVDDGAGVGIAFSRSDVQSNVGAAIIFERTGAGSKGDLHFYTKTATGNGVSPVKALSVTSNSEVLQHVQPAFNVKTTSDSSTTFITTTFSTIEFSSEIFDVGANFSSFTFTAPVTGKYFFTSTVKVNTLINDNSNYWLRLNTSNRVYYGTIVDSDDLDNGGSLEFFTFNVQAVADMDANDTAVVQIRRQGGSSGARVNGDATSSQYSYFHGYLLG